MACMEHQCTNPTCDWFTFNNQQGPGVCPKCGHNVSHHFDEDPIDHDPGPNPDALSDEESEEEE